MSSRTWLSLFLLLRDLWLVGFMCSDLSPHGHKMAGMAPDDTCSFQLPKQEVRDQHRGLAEAFCARSCVLIRNVKVFQQTSLYVSRWGRRLDMFPTLADH